MAMRADERINVRKKCSLDLVQYHLTLAFVLVGTPAIDRFCELRISDQSPVWWCPTSVLCSVPLRTIGPGPILSAEATSCTSQISTFPHTPALSALIQSCECGPDSQTPDRPSLLLVAHHGPSPVLLYCYRICIPLGLSRDRGDWWTHCRRGTAHCRVAAILHVPGVVGTMWMMSDEDRRDLA